MFEGSRALNILKIELLFLKLRGYSPRSKRPELFFEDSPSCVKHSCAGGTCSGCPLVQFVPPELRLKEPVCRSIPLDDNGATLDLLYKYADSRETEEAVQSWLEQTIERLEDEKLAYAALSAAAKSVPALLNSR